MNTKFYILLSASLALCARIAEAQPTIQSVYPPTLTQRVGDHLAYHVSAATANGPLTYQWSFNGAAQNNVALAGQTASTLVLTNLQITNAGTYWVRVGDASGTFVSNSVILNVSSGYFALGATNLIVARVGDGNEALSLALGNTIYLDQYTSNGTYLNTTMIPDETPANVPAPGPALLVAGAGNDAVYEAVLTTSGNQEFLNLAGYNETYPSGGTDATLAGPHSRGLFEINAFGYLGLAYTNAGLYSGGNHTIRAAASSDGLTNFWCTGQAGAGGIKYVNSTVASYATGSGIPVVTSSGPNCRVVQVIQSNLLFSDWVGAAGSGIYSANGLPMPAPSGTSPSSLFLLEGGQPNDFTISPDGQTIYISDDRPFSSSSAQGGGIERWDTNTADGGWTFTYTLAPTAGTNGARGLTVDFSAHSTWGAGVLGAVLYATSASSITNSLVRIVDEGSTSAASTLASAGTNELLCGVRFGPSVPAPVVISTQPQNQIVPAGSNAVFTVIPFNASGPFSFQWYKAGTLLSNGPTGTGSIISGVTSNSLTISNISVKDCTNYSVVVSNPGSSVTSSNAALDLAITITTQPVSVGLQAGGTAQFTVVATGNGPLTYQWELNGSPLANGGYVSGATTPTLTITNVADYNVAAYSVLISDSYVATTTSSNAYLEIGTLGTGTGLFGQYWSNQPETPNAAPVFDGPPTLTRIDPTVNFNWGSGSPDPSISPTQFAVIWSGEVQPIYTDNYTFYTTTDDGCILYVDGQEIIDDWVTQSATQYSGSIQLTANQLYPIVMYYFQNTGVSSAQLSWSGTLEPMQIIPQSQLYPAASPNFALQPTNQVSINAGGTLLVSGGGVSGSPPFSYQWNSNGVPIPGQTNFTLDITNVSAGMNSDTLTLTVTNAYGSTNSTGTLLLVSSGMPVISSDIQPTNIEALVGMPVSLAVGVSGNLPNYQWKYNGNNLSDNGRITGSRSNVLTITQALESDAGTYQLFASNSLGSAQSVAATLTVTRIALNDGSDWTLNGTPDLPTIVSNTLTLTDNDAAEAASAWVDFPLYIGAFTASWTYQESPGANAADGVCFVLQNKGLSALGGSGGNLGFSGITPSAALELNVYTGNTGGIGIAFGTNGLTGEVVGAGGEVGNPYSSTAPVNLASGDPINVKLEYLNGVASVTLTDAVAQTTFSVNYTINLPSILGGNTAYVGFTGSTEATVTSQQTISNFLYSGLPTLSVKPGGPGAVLISWPSVSSAGFVLQESPVVVNASWSDVTNSVTLVNGSYQVSVSPAASQFYRLALP